MFTQWTSKKVCEKQEYLLPWEDLKQSMLKNLEKIQNAWTVAAVMCEPLHIDAPKTWATVVHFQMEVDFTCHLEITV